MILIKIAAIALIFLLFYIFRKWFFRHNIFILLLIPVFIFILYSDYFISVSDDSKKTKTDELEKWKEELKDNFVKPDKSNLDNVPVSNRKIGDVLYDTTFNVNSLKIHYKEFLVALPENIYSYDSTRVEMQIIDENDSLLQIIKEDIYAISSPLETDDGYNILYDEGIFLDYNFDGYKDISLRVGNGANNNAVNGYFYIYLFDPVAKLFIKYDEELYNPAPIAEKKMVVFFNIISSYDDHTISEYCDWVNGRLVLKESVESIFLPEESDENIAKYKETKTLFQNGKAVSKSERIVEEKINKL